MYLPVACLMTISVAQTTYIESSAQYMEGGGCGIIRGTIPAFLQAKLGQLV
jgi:hypothetical protein